jgi:hypothetical protein
MLPYLEDVLFITTICSLIINMPFFGYNTFIYLKKSHNNYLNYKNDKLLKNIANKLSEISINIQNDHAYNIDITGLYNVADLLENDDLELIKKAHDRGFLVAIPSHGLTKQGFNVYLFKPDNKYMLLLKVNDRV